MQHHKRTTSAIANEAGSMHMINGQLVPAGVPAGTARRAGAARAAAGKAAKTGRSSGSKNLGLDVPPKLK
jgi:hypothetical protein